MDILKSFTILALAAICLPLFAEDDEKPIVNISFDTRAEFATENPKIGESTTGFHGRYFNLRVDGQINDQFSYSWRQRLNKTNTETDYFNATDWAYLTYKPTENIALSGGKQIVAIGGYEYDAAPIDIYYFSQFWANVYCYAFGASASYTTNNGNHTLTAQVCNSPLTAPVINAKCFAYNLLWNGKMGAWSTIWSANLVEYAQGKFGQYIALGNRFDIGQFNLELDLMNRHFPHSKFWLDDYSLIAKAQVNLSKVNLFAKGGYERYKLCHDGVIDAPIEKPFYGAGIEYFPINTSKNRVRLHANWNLTNHNDNQTSQFMAGLTWRCNLLSFYNN